MDTDMPQGALDTNFTDFHEHKERQSVRIGEIRVSSHIRVYQCSSVVNNCVVTAEGGHAKWNKEGGLLNKPPFHLQLTLV
jgi:hypothetical protein